MATPDRSSPDVAGNNRAADLFPVVYENLRRLAAKLLSQNVGPYTLQATALVNEAYVRLTSSKTQWETPEHFIAAAARTMRCILVDSHRRKGVFNRIVADGHVGTHDLQTDPPILDLIALDDALTRLSEVDALASQVVEFRFFAGLTLEQTAGALGISRRSVSDKWAFARAWLLVMLEGESDEESHFSRLLTTARS